MALQKITGKIKKAGAYPLPAPKTLTFNGQSKEVTHRHTIQMETGEWVSFGESHLDAFMVKDDDDKWKVLGEGSEVLIKYTANGDYKNAKKANLTVLELVEGKKFEKTNSAPAQKKPSSQGDSFVNPAEIGQCMNLAAEVLGFSGGDMTNPDKAKEAIQWYKRSRQLFTSLYPSVGVEEAVKPQPKPEAATPQYDDDEV